MPPEGVTDPIEAYRRRGHELAEVVRQIAAGPMQDVTGPIASQLKVLDLPPGEPLPYSKALELARDIPLDCGLVPYPDRRRRGNWIRALIRHYKEGLPFPTRSSDYVCTDDALLVPKLPEPRKYECRYEEVLGATIGPLRFIATRGR